MKDLRIAAMNKKILRACPIVLLLALSMSARAQQGATGTDAGQNGEQAAKEFTGRTHDVTPLERFPRYLLRPSDILQLTFPVTPEFDQLISVQPDGYISLRGVGDLHVAGKSLPDLSEMLQKAYKPFLHNPIINIELKEFEKPYFIAGGEIGHPGKYELRGDTTVAEAVSIAGGFTDKAKHSEVLIFRRTEDGWLEAKRLDVKKMLTAKNLSEDIHLRAGDLVYVPKNKLSKLRQFLPSSAMGFSIPDAH